MQTGFCAQALQIKVLRHPSVEFDAAHEVVFHSEWSLYTCYSFYAYKYEISSEYMDVDRAEDMHVPS